MDLGSLRTLVTALNFSAHGLPVTVQLAGQDPVTTRGIWLTPITDDLPSSTELQRREASAVLALLHADVPVLPRGTIVFAPRRAGEADVRWRVDGFDRLEAEHTRAHLVAAPVEAT